MRSLKPLKLKVAKYLLIKPVFWIGVMCVMFIFYAIALILYHRNAVVVVDGAMLLTIATACCFLDRCGRITLWAYKVIERETADTPDSALSKAKSVEPNVMLVRFDPSE